MINQKPIFDGSVLPDDDVLVLYSEKNQHDLYFIDSYMDAAKRIVDSIRKPAGASEDYLCLPLLNLYVHAIEFSLKALVKHLKEHCDLKTCSAINVAALSAVVPNHEIGAMATAIKLALPVGGFHQFENFASIKNFITMIEKLGVGSESTRYLKNHRSQTQSLYREQVPINYRLLHSTIDAICSRILRYIDGQEFYCCGWKLYRKKCLKTLGRAAKALNFIKPSLLYFETYHQSSINSIGGPMSPYDDKTYLNQLRMLYNVLDSYSDSQLSWTLYGLYLEGGFFNLEDFSFFNSWTRDRKIEKIVERRRCCSAALSKLYRAVAGSGIGFKD